jgi:hypothetical protein
MKTFSEATKAVVAALAELEAAHGGLVEFLQEKGIKAKGRVCSNCPVVTYLIPFALPWSVGCNFTNVFLHGQKQESMAIEADDALFVAKLGPNVKAFVGDVTNCKSYTDAVINERKYYEVR